MPAELPEEKASLFREVLIALEKQHTPYDVSGAFARRQHTGICRVTKDVDLLMTAKTVCEALPTLRDCGFQCEMVDPVWLAKARKEEFFVDLITGMSNAVLLVEDSWIERGSPAVVQGIETRVLAPEELVASKIFVARRERFDGADIAQVIYGSVRLGSINAVDGGELGNAVHNVAIRSCRRSKRPPFIGYSTCKTPAVKYLNYNSCSRPERAVWRLFALSFNLRLSVAITSEKSHGAVQDV